jgi:hypothetical protein
MNRQPTEHEPKVQDGGPSWDAAMGLVDELEADLRRIDQAVTPRIRLAVGAPSR